MTKDEKTIIRPYREEDFSCLEKWIDSERIHAFWCASLLPYPLTRKSFHAFLEKNAADWGDRACVAADENDIPIGFFSCCVNSGTKEGFLKFIIIDPARRGTGCGARMLRLTLQHIFRTTDADLVQLNVFAENPAARRCYEKVGFTERRFEKDSFPYQNESWSRCNMIIQRTQFFSRQNSIISSV